MEQITQVLCHQKPFKIDSMQDGHNKQKYYMQLFYIQIKEIQKLK